MRRHLYVFGYPSAVGGASTELWHLLKLWRRHDCAVTVIPTWSIPTGWRERVDALGCETLTMRANDVALPDGSIAVALCNAPFLAAVPRLQNCRLVYLPCMTYLNDPLESQTCRDNGPLAAYVFQSRFQRDTLLPGLAEAGVPQNRCHVIPGAFDAGELPYQPRHRNGVPFCFGRLSRPDPRKFRADWWAICEAGRGRVIQRPMVCRTMGWHRMVERKCGPAPVWCETLPKAAESSADFLRSLDCLVQLGDVAENWPRVGLEAMAAGVPIVADNRGGWREMIESGRSGLLVDDPEEAAAAIVRLSTDEPHRLELAQAARQRVIEKLADETLLWQLWSDLFISQES